MKYEKVHQIYKKYLEIEEVEPTLVNNIYIIIVIFVFTWSESEFDAED